MNIIEVTCMNKGCNNKFRVPEFKFNSTIKNNPKKQECNICKNRKLLAQSTFARKNKRTEDKSGKYTIKINNGKKRLKTPKQKARDRADMWFSRYIRIKYHFKIVDGEVYCQCIVNPSVIKLAKHMDNGHFESRARETTRYYEDNCRPQNRSSNRFSGEADHRTFGINLRNQIGHDRFNLVMDIACSYSEQILDVFYYEEIAEKYRTLTNQLVKELNIKKWW